MKKNKSSLLPYLLIGIGLYFLLREWKIPILTDFYSWPTLLIIIGLAFLIHSFKTKEYKNLFPGVLLFGLGIHFHGLTHYPFWIDHWGMFTLILGIAFLSQAWKLKNGLVPAIILLLISFIAIFVDNKPEWFSWINNTMNWLFQSWPILLVIGGVYMLVKKK